MNLLFVCGDGVNRSGTAQTLFNDPMRGFNARCGGIDADALWPLAPEDIDWADVVMTMENWHLNVIRHRYSRHITLSKRLLCLDIPGPAIYMEPFLVNSLTDKVETYLAELNGRRRVAMLDLRAS